MKHRALLTSMFDAAIDATRPELTLAEAMPEPPKGRTIVIGAGKGAAHLAKAFEAKWSGPLQGLVVTRYGYAVPTAQIEVVEAAHPVPDMAGLQAAKRIMAMVGGLTADDLVVALIAGGGSALLPAPLAPLVLEDEIHLNEALLSSGAPISALNLIRNQFSAIKGGRLALMAHPARVHTIVVSDVPGDDPAQVASGPTLPGSGHLHDAVSAIAQHRIQLTQRLHAFLEQSPPLSPTPDDPAFAGNTCTVIASAQKSLSAAGAIARLNGWSSTILSDGMEGESRCVGAIHGDIAKQIRIYGNPLAAHSILLSGGETTVSLCPSPGRGGPNTEFLLALAIRIDGLEGIEALAADTDGIDGSEDNAGAFIDGTTCARLRAQGLDPHALLETNNAYAAFEALDDLFCPGPTGTNVNDFRAVLVS